MKVLSLLLRNPDPRTVQAPVVHHASMKVLSLLLRNQRMRLACECQHRLNESPELIAQECDEAA